MKILHVIATGHRRGAETFASDLAGALDRRGVRQLVVVLRPKSGVQVPFPCGVSTASPGGVPVVRRLKEVRRAIAGFEPDLVQVHGGQALKHTIPVAGRTPVVYRRIGAASWIGSMIQRRFYSALMRRAAWTIAVAESVRSEAIDVFRLDPDRVVAIANGVDRARIAPQRDRGAMRAELGLAQDAPCVLFAGSLSADKNPEAAIQAVAELSRRTTMIVAGDGPLRERCEKLAADIGVLDRVSFLGQRPDIGDLMVAADVLVLTSRTEGMPAVLIEAGMLGLSAVAPDLLGVSEVIEDGVTGSVVPVDDAQATIAELRAWLGDAGRRRRASEVAPLACARFDIDVVAERYVDVYRSVIST